MGKWCIRARSDRGWRYLVSYITVGNRVLRPEWSYDPRDVEPEPTREKAEALAAHIWGSDWPSTTSGVELCELP